MGAPDFWDNPDAAQKTAQAVTQLKEEVGIVHNLEQRLDDLEVMVELALEEPESGMEEELEAGLEAAKAEIEHLELGMLLNGEYDANNAILTLHAGAGGTEAQDWTSMLLRMFTRYAERQGFAIEMLDYLPGDEAGVKSATLQINGHNAYGYLRSERVYTASCAFLRLTPTHAAILLLRLLTLCLNLMIPSILKSTRPI